MTPSSYKLLNANAQTFRPPFDKKFPLSTKKTNVAPCVRLDNSFFAVLLLLPYHVTPFLTLIGSQSYTGGLGYNIAPILSGIFNLHFCYAGIFKFHRFRISYLLLY